MLLADCFIYLYMYILALQVPAVVFQGASLKLKNLGQTKLQSMPYFSASSGLQPVAAFNCVTLPVCSTMLVHFHILLLAGRMSTTW